MSDTVVESGSLTEGTAKIVYVLYLVGILFGLTTLIGVVMAYVNRGDAPEWLKTHYQYQIRTFWIGALYLIIGAITSLVLVGYLILLFWLVWTVVRMVKGMKQLDAKKAVENPTGWLF
ncbi:DUF4870 family protein [Enterovibrio norvegicus]|uniref:DUF4870 family protein n=1 Tax=Enterovibrio norvegicus TaxID=188144 RepID=UPI0024B04E37|nr:hypothetical protein [Enterovibrio norvegicus]